MLHIVNMELSTETLEALSPFEIADLICQKDLSEQTRIFSLLPLDIAIETFDYLPLRDQKKIINALDPKQSAALLGSLWPDDRTQFLEELSPTAVEALTKLLPNEERILTYTLLGYPEGSVGRLMTPDYLAVHLEWSVEDVLNHIRRYGHDSETINVIYVIDDEEKLLDDINLKEFLFVPRDYKVKDLSDSKFIALSVYDNAEQTIKVFQQNDRIALPVIDEKNILLGIVTIDDILRLSNSEATEDIQKIGGTQALDEPYMNTPFLELMKKRGGWLIVLFVGELLTTSVMSYFEEELARAIILSLFIPLIISSGGNAGSQASTLIIRAMALGEVKIKDTWRVIKREMASGLFLGTVLGSIGFFRVFLWNSFSNAYGEYWMLIGFTLFFSLLGVVLCGTISGAVLPLLMRYLKIDPATASAPFVATFVDVAGILIYFLLAILILSGTLL